MFSFFSSLRRLFLCSSLSFSFRFFPSVRSPSCTALRYLLFLCRSLPPLPPSLWLAPLARSLIFLPRSRLPLPSLLISLPFRFTSFPPAQRLTNPVSHVLLLLLLFVDTFFWPFRAVWLGVIVPPPGLRSTSMAGCKMLSAAFST